MIFYEYAETSSKDVRPEGEGWEYWSDKVTPKETVAVWRREEGKYNDGHSPTD